MLALLVLLASTALAWPKNTFTVDTVATVDHDFFEKVQDTGSGCKFYVKNGNHGGTTSKHGIGVDQHVDIHISGHVSVDNPTWIWTSCDDGLLIDQAWLTDDNNKVNWGRDEHGAWCLSTDWRDHHRWEGTGNRVSGCWRTLLFNNDGLVYFYLDQNWTPDGRRSLAEVPTVEDVQECEADDSRDQSECNALVDQILTDDMTHPENLVLLPQDEDLVLEALKQEQMQQRAMMAELSAGVRASMFNVKSAAEPMTFDDYVVYAFAALGMAAFVGGAYKTFQKWSSSSEHVPISYQSATNELEI
jgi:hypothetical protein